MSVALGCGARTQLAEPADVVGGDGGNGDDVLADGFDFDGPINCSLHAGAVPSCDSGSDANPVVRCAPGYACEFNLGHNELWGCCINTSYGVVCRYAEPGFDLCP